MSKIGQETFEVLQWKQRISLEVSCAQINCFPIEEWWIVWRACMTFRKFIKHQSNILFTIGRVFKIPRPCTHVDICSRYVHPPHRKSFCSLRLMCIFTNYNRSLQTRSLNWPLIFSTLWLFNVWVYHWVFYLWRMGAWKLIHLWSEVCSIARPCTEHV